LEKLLIELFYNGIQKLFGFGVENHIILIGVGLINSNISWFFNKFIPGLSLVTFFFLVWMDYPLVKYSSGLLKGRVNSPKIFKSPH